MNSLAVLLAMSRSIQHLRVFDNLRYLISLVNRAFVDGVPFLVVALYSVVAFAFIVKVLNSFQPEQEQDFIKILQNCYFYIATNVSTDNYILSDWIMDAIRSIIVTVTLLSLFIAIVENSYKSIKAQHKFYDLQAKVEIITDFDTFLFNIGVGKKQPVQFEHMLFAFHSDLNEGGEAEELKRFETQSEVLSQKVDEFGTCLDAALTNLHLKVQARNARKLAEPQDEGVDRELEDIGTISAMQQILSMLG